MSQQQPLPSVTRRPSKTRRMELRLTDSERQLLSQLSAHLGTTDAGTIRLACRLLGERLLRDGIKDTILSASVREAAICSHHRVEMTLRKLQGQ